MTDISHSPRFWETSAEFLQAKCSPTSSPSFLAPQTRETFLDDEQLWVHSARQCFGNNPNISIFSHGVVRRMLPQGARSRGEKGCVCQRCTAGRVEGLREAWPDPGPFAHRVACFPPWSNAITSLFSSYRKCSECQPQLQQRSNANTPAPPQVLRADDVWRKRQFTVSFRQACGAEGKSLGRQSLGRFLSASLTRPHPCLLLPLFLKNHYLSSIFFFSIWQMTRVGTPVLLLINHET